MAQQLHAPADRASGSSDLIAVLRDKAPRAAMLLAAGQAVTPLARMLRDRARDATLYTVKVPGTDEMYGDLHEWLLGLLPPPKQRALIAFSTRHSSRRAVDEPETRRAEPVLRLQYDGSREQPITINGHTIRVMVVDREQTEDGRYFKPSEITFTASTPTARDALLAELARVVRHAHAVRRQPVVRMLDQWDDWVRLDNLQPRSLDSVVLPAGQMDRIIDDISRFLASEDEYTRRGLPWHRGHLYSGPSGTGKTSAVRAIATHFGLDLSYLPLADVKRDGELQRLAFRIGPRSILLLEDADVFDAAASRGADPVDEHDKGDGRGVTLSGLLNTLDGIATPHGLITVLTTNRPEVLDPAVIRPGRVDLIEHFGCADTDVIHRIMSRYYDKPVEVTGFGARAITPAMVLEACKRHDNPESALAELRTPASHQQQHMLYSS